MLGLSRDLILVLLVVLMVTSLVIMLLYPRFSGDALIEKRRNRILKLDQNKNHSARGVDLGQRRKQIIESLQEGEIRQKKERHLTLERRIIQSGLRLTKTQFITWSFVSGFCLALILFLYSDDAFSLVLGYVLGGFGLPFLILNWLRSRRVAHFLEHFAAATDIIVRGVRAGLPVSECLILVAQESQEPVASEFRLMHDAQSIGITLAESVERMADRIPATEVRFFAILISIQQGSGGNLSEGLSNLSSMLRDRKKMQQKIRSVSAEAKASAAIIGSLPFGISGIVHFTSPGYLNLFFETEQGQIILAICLVWMVIGVLVMKRMIDFDI